MDQQGLEEKIQHLIAREVKMKSLFWAIGVSSGEFKLLAVKCNNPDLKQRFIQESQLVWGERFHYTILSESDTFLFSKLSAELSLNPSFVMVSGFEEVDKLHELLCTANLMRDSFYHLKCPIIFWMSDMVWYKFRGLAPDFERCAISVILED
jgi:hypothetical protein